MKTAFECTLALLAGPALAARLEISIELPRMAIAEYHRPYVAIWIEKPDQTVAANLAVWHQLQDNSRGEKGTTWLKDLRMWWRKIGRELTMPVDGVSAATRPAGLHRVRFSGARPPLSRLSPGSYQLVVEAAREMGGREVVRVPFDWPASESQLQKAQGRHELGLVQVQVKP